MSGWKRKLWFRRLSLILALSFLMQVTAPVPLQAGHTGHWLRILQQLWDYAESIFRDSDCPNEELPCYADGCVVPQSGVVTTFEGRELVQEVDFYLPGRVSPLLILRTYRSGAKINNFFGPGWDMSFNKRVIKRQDGAMFFLMGEGDRIIFTCDGDCDSSPNTYTAPEGRREKLIDNGPGATYPFTVMFEDGTKYDFDLNGDLAGETDRNGNYIEYSWTTDPQFVYGIPNEDGSGRNQVIAKGRRVYEIVDTVGRVVTLSYYDSGDNAGRLHKISYDGKDMTYEYDTYGNLVRVIDQAGRVKEYVYDYPLNVHLLTADKNFAGEVTSRRSFDKMGRVVVEEYADGGAATFDYYNPDEQTALEIELSGVQPCQSEFLYTFPYGRSQRTTYTDPLGNSVVYEYDEFGDPVSITADMGTGDPNDDVVFEYEYDENHQVTKAKDGLGNLSYIEYDNDLNPIKITNALGEVTNIYYERSSDYAHSPASYNRIVEIDAPPDYQDLRFIYYDGETQGGPAAAHNLRRIQRGYADSTHTAPHFQTVATFEYDSYGQIKKVIDANGKEWAYSYGASPGQSANISSITMPKNSDGGPNPTINFPAYDVWGRLLEVQDPLGHSTTFNYDEIGRLTELVLPPAGGNTFTANIIFEDAQKRMKIIDANGIETIYESNTMGWTNKIKLGKPGDSSVLPNEVNYSWNIGRTLEFITDALEQHTYYEYDGLTRLIHTTRENGTYEEYEYDHNGNLIAKTDARGNIITFKYDKLDRPTEKNYPDGSFIKLTYVGNRISNIEDYRAPSDDTLTINYTYDNLYRISSVTDVHDEQIKYTYDDTDNITQIHHVGHDPENYTYYDDGSVKTIEVGGVVEAVYQYNISALRDRVDLGNGTWTTYSYDDHYRVTTISHNSTSGEFLRFDYTYDVDGLGQPLFKGMKTGMVLSEYGVVVQTERYFYDDLYRLAEVIQENDPSTND